eukprot:jgi/Tetstr1/447099/TSEL_034537.t1
MENWHGDLSKSYLKALTRAGANASDGFSQQVTMFKHIVVDSDVIKVYMSYTMEAIEAFFRLQEVEFASGSGAGFRSMRINRKGSIPMAGPPML